MEFVYVKSYLIIFEILNMLDEINEIFDWSDSEEFL